MRRFLAAVAALVAALVVLPVPPAQAGGPTSVIIVNHARSLSAAAVTGSAVYDDLTAALDAFNPPTGDQSPPAKFMESGIRLTWFIHDVTPWRVDGLVIDGTDVWVSTSMSTDGTNLFEQPTTWHRAKDPKLLLATLRTLRVIDNTEGAAVPAVGATERATVLPDPGQTPVTQTTANAVAGASTAGGATGPEPVGVPVPALVAACLLTLALGLIGGRWSRREAAPPPRTAPSGEPDRAVGLTPSR